MTRLLDPKVDFIFKNIFGSEKHPRILISFLNAVMKPKVPIVGVEMKEIDINDDKQRALYEAREKANKDRTSALAESRREGIEEGIEKGIEIGLQEGEKKGKLETAKKMLSKGMSIEDIIEFTGLTAEEIEKSQI